MYCPKCGGESQEGQRFCKACGTNLQLINDALRSPGPFGLNVEELARNAKEFAQSWKTSWSGTHFNVGANDPGSRSEEIRDRYRSAREIRRRAREEARRQNLPRPKEYMSYSWQHNLKSGLVSLFWGTGLGVFLYYFSQNAIESGLIRRLEEGSEGHVQGLEPLARMVYLIALLPILKGLAQIFYAAFFGESMATLTARFTPAAQLEEPKPFIRQNTAPVDEREPLSRGYESSDNAPPSVTEHTTHIFEEKG